MELMQEKKRLQVREGFRILLRAEAELSLPSDAEQIADYYRKTAASCLGWAEAFEGKRLREEYLQIEDHRGRAAFPTSSYRLTCEPIWHHATHAAWLCRSVLQVGQRDGWIRHMAQVWCLREQTVLPLSQLLKLCRPQLPGKLHLPFRPDGAYPCGGELIFFRNPRQGGEIQEHRIPFRLI